ncbi:MULTISPECIES: phage regulatory CII family protein [unclassified Nitratiruptor]|uniref:phage regulatory CII family protein n=1 Tax=unclassified Nitratiruptor TaxID=2624044 RepID=UPI001916A896|nr:MULTISPECIES: phage regulatory CII family protein [unclassified Nitratiruptor]
MEDFAHEIGLSEGTLENKLKPASPYDLTLTEFIHIMDITAAYSPLEYIAKRYGYTLCKPETNPQKSDDPVIAVTLQAFSLEEVQGSLAKTIKEAIADGVLDEAEKSQINDIAHQLRKLAAELQESLK